MGAGKCVNSKYWRIYFRQYCIYAPICNYAHLEQNWRTVIPMLHWSVVKRESEGVSMSSTQITLRDHSKNMSERTHFSWISNTIKPYAYSTTVLHPSEIAFFFFLLTGAAEVILTKMRLHENVFQFANSNTELQMHQ